MARCRVCGGYGGFTDSDGAHPACAKREARIDDAAIMAFVFVTLIATLGVLDGAGDDHTPAPVKAGCGVEVSVTSTATHTLTPERE